MIITMSNSSYLYEQFKYPAGEWQVRLTDIIVEELLKNPEEHTVISRIKNADDIQKTLLLMDAIYGVTQRGMEIDLILPYLPYSRADRRFKPGDCAGKYVFLQQFYTAPYNSIKTLDIHSNPNIGCVVNVSAEPFIKKTIESLQWEYNGRVIVLFPDKGARDRYGFVSDIPNVRVFNCEKQRDPITGKFNGFEVPTQESLLDETDPVLIVDDLCDAGGTFLGIHQQANYKNPMHLYVTHGIFSKGVSVLTDKFRKVFTTDSYTTYDNDTPIDRLFVYPCISAFFPIE